MHRRGFGAQAGPPSATRVGCEGDCTSTYKWWPPAGEFVQWCLRLPHNVDHQQGCVGESNRAFLVHKYTLKKYATYRIT